LQRYLVGVKNMRLTALHDGSLSYRSLRMITSALLALGMVFPTLAYAQNSQAMVVKESPLVKVSDYYSTKRLMLSDGEEIEQSIIHGPPKPPPGLVEQRQFADMDEIERGVAKATVLSVPAFNWVFGCSAVSGAMIASFYDRNGYPNIYTGPTNGGVMPTTSASWPTWTDGAGASYPSNPLIASRNGVDGRAIRGSIDNYWVQYDSTANDPYITNGWAQHVWGDAIGDYMWTSQSAHSNSDGSTTFYNYTSSASQLSCATMASGGYKDGSLGRKLFYEARGYTVTDCYNQKTDNEVTGGFSFNHYKAEIDAGHPVMLNLAGHTVVGVGYDTASGNTVYLQDTWDTSVHTMTWGSSYAGMALQSVSIVRLSGATAGTYTLNVNSSGATGVAISASPTTYAGSTGYSATGIAAGTAITLTAPASSGSATFSSWSGCDSTSSMNCTVTMNASKSVTAIYTAAQTPLTNGGSVTLSGAAGSEAYYYVTLPAGATNLSIAISGGTGDADLYVKQGAIPTTSSYDCRPYVNGNNETCNFASPAAGTWYVMVRGYSSFSGATLQASYTAGGYTLTVGSSGPAGVAIDASPAIYAGSTSYSVTGIAAGTGITLTAPVISGGASFTSWSGCDSTSSRDCTVTMNATKNVTANYTTAGTAQLTNGVSVMLSGATGSETYYYLIVPSGASSLNVSTSGGTGDADLYVKQGALPTTSSYDCRPYSSTNNETCSFASPTAGYWYVMVHGYASYHGVSLLATYTAAPSAPTITSISPAAARITLTFNPPSSTGGSAITSYTATCSSSGQPTRTATGAGSPLVVRQLTGGRTYSCAVTATNSASQTGPASTPATATPRAVSIAPILLLLE
jgi:hypothetical protein